MFNIDLELQDLTMTMTLPACLELEIVADLTDYLNVVMRPFTCRQVAHRIIFSLPRIPTDWQVEKFIELLRLKVDCWYVCYPKKVEEERGKAVMLGKHLKVVPTAEI